MSEMNEKYDDCFMKEITKNLFEQFGCTSQFVRDDYFNYPVCDLGNFTQQ